MSNAAVTLAKGLYDVGLALYFTAIALPRLLLTLVTGSEMSAWPKTTRDASDKQCPDVLIIGAGFSGIITGIKLKHLGVPFTIIDKSDGVGGTWRDNTYPGSGCDVPSWLYSISFAPKHTWSRKWAKQPEILEYMETVANEHQLYPHMKFGKTVERMVWNEEAGKWTVHLAGGEKITSRVVVSGVGQLNYPSYPKIPGVESFEGTTFHSARWDHDVDLTGKRVAVIGNGASAIQFVPEIAKVVKELTVYQRTPSYVWDKPDFVYWPWVLTMFNTFPVLSTLYRWFTYLNFEKNWIIFGWKDSIQNRLLDGIIKWQIRRQLTKPDLEEKVIPDYVLGCKRVLISNEYYPTLCKPNVHLETNHVDRITRDSVITKNGTENKVDAVLYATGFKTTEFLFPMEIIGKDGVSLSKAWDGNPAAFKGMTMPGFPNLFMLYGPNTNLGHNSIIFMLECETDYIVSNIHQMAEQGYKSTEVRQDALDRYQETVDDNIEGTVYGAECNSWYRSPKGKLTNNWSGTTTEFWYKTRACDVKNNYDVKYV